MARLNSPERWSVRRGSALEIYRALQQVPPGRKNRNKVTVVPILKRLVNFIISPIVYAKYTRILKS